MRQYLPSVTDLAGRALRQLFRFYELLRGIGRDAGPELAPDGLQLPPRQLRFRVAGTPEIEPFLHGGQLAATTVRDLLAKAGRPVDACSSILDFGCGCGRVLRQWKDLRRTAIYGCDFNPEVVQWCEKVLPFSSVSVNSDAPPLAFNSSQFDAIYAFSVFTHLPETLQKQWLEEFRRILKPGGLLIFSTHGSYYMPRLRKSEREQFLEGQLVVRFGSVAGSNLCNTFHPEAFVRGELATGWDVVEFAPEGALGNPRQDAWVLRRRQV
jgi:SAM-dependent methyltransferase